MAFQSVPLTAQVNIRYGTSGTTNWGPAENVLHFLHDGAYDLPALADLAQQVTDWVVASILPLLSADVELSSVIARGLANDPDIQAFGVTGIGTAGAQGANVLPSNVAACLRFTTGFVGRSTRGRVYLPGLAVNAFNDDDLTTTFQPLILDAFQTDLPAALSADWTWVIVSRFHNGVKRAVGVTLPITGVSYSSTQAATQQRRLHRYP